MPSNLAWLQSELAELGEQHLLRRRRVVQSLPDAWCLVDGKRQRDFASNDYLNLAHDERVIKAATEALQTSGVGARASALISGRSPFHQSLEARLSTFEGTAACVLFPSGYAANVGTLTALLRKQDTVISDRFNHASLIDGCRLSRAQLHIYEHHDLTTLETALRQPLQTADARRFIVTDSVFSMDGDVAPLPDICDLADQHRAHVIIDEAHATGVLGSRGRGLAEEQGVEERVAVRIGTLSKAIGCQGGFVTGNQQLVDWLWNRARTQFFSTAMSPPVCAAASESLRIITHEPQRRDHLRQLSNLLREELQQRGLQTQPDAHAPIVPVILADPERASLVAEQLAGRGYLVGGIRPPTVPPGTSRLRITLSAAHQLDEIRDLARAIDECVQH